jgi:hypothetical protein
MVLGLPYRALSAITTNSKQKKDLSVPEEALNNDEEVILSRGEDEDLFVDEDSNNIPNSNLSLNMPKLLYTPSN